MPAVLLLLSGASLAYSNHRHNLAIAPSKGWFPKPERRQFQSWYPGWRSEYEEVSNGVCNATLAAYNTAYDARPGSKDAARLLNACYLHESCILDNLETAHAVNLQAATVVLGLMPSLIAAIGPSVAEISLLSTHRPVLSFLISLSAPGIWPTRLLESTDPTSLLRKSGSGFRVLRKPARYAIPISIAQYAVLCGCIANVILLSIGAGQNAILSWGCTTTFAPLLWSLLPCIIHFVAASSYICSRRPIEAGRGCSPTDKPRPASNQPNVRPVTVAFKQLASTMSSVSLYFAKLCKREFALCANHTFARELIFRDHLTDTSTFLNVAAGIMGYIHVTFGILVFSSLQFVAVNDVRNIILIRYIASSFVARLVLIFELAGLRNIVRIEEQNDVTAP